MMDMKTKIAMIKMVGAISTYNPEKLKTDFAMKPMAGSTPETRFFMLKVSGELLNVLKEFLPNDETITPALEEKTGTPEIVGGRKKETGSVKKK